jgi:hypothetical protein
VGASTSHNSMCIHGLLQGSFAFLASDLSDIVSEFAVVDLETECAVSIPDSMRLAPVGDQVSMSCRSMNAHVPILPHPKKILDRST